MNVTTWTPEDRRRETIPAPPEPKRHHCGNCGRRYSDTDCTRDLATIGCMDLDEDGDQRLVLYNCTCAGTGPLGIPGTFAVSR